MTNLNVWLQTTELKLRVPVPLPHCPGNGPLDSCPPLTPGRLSHALYLRISISSQRRAPANTCPTCFLVQIKSPTGPEGQCWNSLWMGSRTRPSGQLPSGHTDAASMCSPRGKCGAPSVQEPHPWTAPCQGLHKALNMN